MAEPQAVAIIANAVSAVSQVAMLPTFIMAWLAKRELSRIMAKLDYIPSKEWFDALDHDREKLLDLFVEHRLFHGARVRAAHGNGDGETVTQG
jgi:hypothetical protein